MPTVWKIAAFETRCGFDASHVIAKGEPYLEIRLREVAGDPRRRCQACGAKFAPADADVIQRARDEAELQNERAAIADSSTPAPPPTPPKRVHLSRPLKPFSSMAELASTFDPRLAQTGEHD